MEKGFFRLLLVISLLVFLYLTVNIVFSATQSSPLQQFNVTTDVIRLNWTNSYRANVSLIASNSSWDGITVELLNDTTTYPNSQLAANYSQGTQPAVCQKIPLLVFNTSSSQYSNTNVTLSSSSISNITLVHTHGECYPGRYIANNFTIRNTTRTNETANITIILDIPIQSNNTLNTTTGVGNFSGSMPINTTVYHSFYFNATSGTDGEIPNPTGVTINISSSQDVDIFLFDSSGILKAKAINKTLNDSLQFNFLPQSSEMWEIRVYGNSTSEISYNGGILFTTLNMTNSSNQLASLIDFRVINSTSNTSQSVTLKNEGNLTLSSVSESKELYYVKRFGGSSKQNFTVLVPNSTITKGVKISLNWTGSGNYSLNLLNQSGLLIANSTNKFLYANKTNATQEEYLETANIGSTSGLWTIEVTNNTNVTDEYNLTAYLYVDTSSWITTNYTTMTFNKTGLNNYTSAVQINLTVPSTAMNGTYEGYVRYLDANKAGIKTPIKIDVTTPMLVVNNTLGNKTFVTDDNYGGNVTRILYFNISNPGFYNVSLSFTDSGNLSCYSGSCSGYNASFVYNTTNYISANSETFIRVNLTFNSTLPANTMYSGWISVNATNPDSKLTAHPFSEHLINLELNLTNLLDLKTDFMSADWSNRVIENMSVGQNITVKADVFYINGTGPMTTLNISNFTSVWLQERNVTSSIGRIPRTGNLSFYAARSPFYCLASCPFGGTNHYFINATVPANTPGGLYDVYVSTSYKEHSSTFTGQASNRTLIINNTGLRMTAMNSTALTRNNGTTYDFYVNVSNYGTKAASSATINFTESCSGYSVAATSYSGCGSTSTSGASFIINPAAQNTSCVVWWTITAGSTAASVCQGNIIGDSPNNRWFDSYGVNVSVIVNCPYCNATPGEPTDGTTDGTTPPTDGEAARHLNITEYTSLVVVVQGESNTTTLTVKNINTTRTQDVKLSVEVINSSWVSVTPSLPSITPLQSVNFTITFDIPDSAEVKDYSGRFVAIGNYANVSKDFTLRVLPSEEEEIEITETFNSYKLNMTELENETEEAKNQGYNVSVVEDKLRELRLTIEQAENYINQGDYFNAYQLFVDIETLLGETRAELEKAKRVEGGGIFEWQPWMIWIFVGLGSVGAVVLAYLFWPTKAKIKGFAPKKPSKLMEVFKKPREVFKRPKEDTWNQLKEKWSKIKKVRKKKKVKEKERFE